MGEAEYAVLCNAVILVLGEGIEMDESVGLAGPIAYTIQFVLGQ